MNGRMRLILVTIGKLKEGFGVEKWQRLALAGFMLTAIVACPAMAVAQSSLPNVTLGDTDCMPIGAVPALPSELRPPSLPFYQPAIGGDSIDRIVISPPTYPTTNRFTVRDDWDKDQPVLIPITTWALSDFTGLTVPGPLSSAQRGHVDAYSRSGVQVVGSSVGLWLNSMDPTTHLYAGSNALNIGCWYDSSAYPKLFPSPQHDLDVSFHAKVPYDGSVGNASAQAYFEFIATDTSGQCTVGSSEQRSACTFTFQVGFYGPATAASCQSVHSDGTNTTTFPIAQAALDSPTWLHKVPGNKAVDYQSAKFDTSNYFHFRISQAEFVNALQEVAMAPGYKNLSLNPLDYGISLLGLNGEVHAPGGDQGQLGLSVTDIRVTSTVPHQVAGSPALFQGNPSILLYRDGNTIGAFHSNENGAFSSQETLVSGSAAGDPSGYFASGTNRVVYRDTRNHIREVFQNAGIWSEWDVSTALALADAYSDPKPYVAADGSAHFVFRDVSGGLHEVGLGANGWLATSIGGTDASIAATGAPMAYTAHGTVRIVYRDVNNHVIELSSGAAGWSAWEMTSLPGSAPAYSDPQGYIGADGNARVVYRDIVGHIHEFQLGADGWHHTDLTASSGAPVALGNPSGFVAGDASRVVYHGIDARLHEIALWAGAWVYDDLSQTRGTMEIVDDPKGFVASDGSARIEYKGADGQLHELYFSSQWLHRDL